MAIFIPEQAVTSTAANSARRLLKRLDNDYVIRRLLAPGPEAPDFLIQRPGRGWLALSLEAAPFSALDPARLFASAERAAFEKRLRALRELGAGGRAEPDPLEGGPGRALVLWGYSETEIEKMRSGYEVGPVRLAASSELEEAVEAGLPWLKPLAPAEEAAWREKYFPESKINFTRPPRRDFSRDNQARLTGFFLDTQQEWASKLDLEPSGRTSELARDFSLRLINGVAGSGKTLIAVSRALLLTELFPRQEVLFLIHNTPITADLKFRLERDRGGWPKRLNIMTVCAWLRRQWLGVFGGGDLDLVSSLRAVQAAPVRPAGLKLSEAQLAEELDFIHGAMIENLDQYLALPRTGRGFTLREKDRTLVWEFKTALEERLGPTRRRMWSQLPYELSRRGPAAGLKKYHRIIIDEAQFFAPSWFQVVKLSMVPEGSLFLCADPNQGFLKHRQSWRRSGLEVVGRTKKLHRAYRSTREIMLAAHSVLALVTPGDEDAAEDYLEPDYQAMASGEAPVLIEAGGYQDALERVVNEVAALGASVPLADLLVIYSGPIHGRTLVLELEKALGEGRIWDLNRDEHKKEPPRGAGRDYLRVARLETATGLEAGAVFLLGLEDLLRTLTQEAKAEEADQPEREEAARKLYMALTRACGRLVWATCRRPPDSVARYFSRDRMVARSPERGL